MLECVVNVAEGRDAATIAALGDACGGSLLDLHVDPDHHRSVFTLAGPGPRDAVGAAVDLARAAADRVAGPAPEGVHPRLGVIDVVPFVALDEPDQVAIDAALGFAAWVGAELGVPSFLYDLADPERWSLPAVRRDAFVALTPDFGPPTPHPRLGATTVGARPPLVAVNCWLDRDDLPTARAIAAAVRASGGGGVPGVRALGFRLPSRGRVQVSMNVTDLGRAGVEAACTAVRQQADGLDVSVAGVEWVGLVPAAELDRCSAGFRAWSGLEASQTIEARLARPGRR